MGYVTEPLFYYDAPVKKPKTYPKDFENLEDSCFRKHIELLIKYTDFICSDKELSNITVPSLECGVMYTARHRPMTLGEMLTHYKNHPNLIKEQETDTCCKKIYAQSIVCSKLSGTTWKRYFCPKCEKTVQIIDGEYKYMFDYPNNAKFPYEPSNTDIFQLVKMLLDKEAETDLMDCEI